MEGDLGELVGGWLTLAATADERVLWCAGEQHAPTGLAPRLVSKNAFLALRDGEVIQGGAIAWNGARWRLSDVAEGGRLVARLVAEGAAA